MSVFVCESCSLILRSQNVTGKVQPGLCTLSSNSLVKGKRLRVISYFVGVCESLRLLVWTDRSGSGVGDVRGFRRSRTVPSFLRTGVMEWVTTTYGTFVPSPVHPRSGSPPPTAVEVVSVDQVGPGRSVVDVLHIWYPFLLNLIIVSLEYSVDTNDRWVVFPTRERRERDKGREESKEERWKRTVPFLPYPNLSLWTQVSQAGD